MQQKTFAKSAPVLARLYKLAQTIQSGDRAQVRDAVRSIRRDPIFAGKKGWKSAFAKLAQTVDTLAPTFSVFATGGNSKLPFVAFSSLPGVTCPGAGSCLDFCYSFRAWRYPAAFARQAQNAFLMRFNGEAIRSEFRRIASKRPKGFDFRLFVDGDFADVLDVAFWMALLAKHPRARAYGYSKSFAELIDYHDSFGGRWPENYRLNLSSGYSDDAARKLPVARTLPIVRGEFVAVSIGRKIKSSDHARPEHQRLVRAAAGPEKVFACPGKCGSCTPSGHACGSAKFAGIKIAIAMH